MFLWNYLQTVTAPILIYGMGNGAEKILLEAKRYKIPIAGIFSSDDHARTVTFQGYPVRSYQEILETCSQGVILVAFGVYQEDVIQRILSLSSRYQVFAPDVPLMGGSILTPEVLDERREEIKTARSLLSDKQSLLVFDAMLRAKLSGNPETYLEADTDRNDDMNLLALHSQEKYLDLGAYNGDTIFEFLEIVENRYTSIDAMEPDAHNFKKLAAAVDTLPKVFLHPQASWDSHTTLTFSGKGGRNCAMKPELPGQYKHLHPVSAIPVDSLRKPFTYVKMDVEGAEAQTLIGMSETLRTYHPKLLVSCYHKPDDFITLPHLLQKLCPGYKMYMRRNRCLPAWEIQLYCIW